MSSQNLNSGYNPAQSGASSRSKIYTVAGITGLSSLLPLTKLAKAGKDSFQKNDGKILHAAGTAIKKNPWAALTALALGSAGVTLASEKSVNSKVPLHERVKALTEGLGTSAVASVTEFGAAGTGVLLCCAGKKIVKDEGKKFFPALTSTLKRNPISALALAGLTTASFWLEKKSAHFQDKAIAGKS